MDKTTVFCRFCRILFLCLFLFVVMALDMASWFIDASWELRCSTAISFEFHSGVSVVTLAQRSFSILLEELATSVFRIETCVAETLANL